jgi:hypothetical protein
LPMAIPIGSEAAAALILLIPPCCERNTSAPSPVASPTPGTGEMAP